MKILKYKEFKEKMSRCLKELRPVYILTKDKTKLNIERSFFMVKNSKWADRSFIVVEPETMFVILVKAGFKDEAGAVVEAKKGIKKEISTRMRLKQKGL